MSNSGSKQAHRLDRKFLCDACSKRAAPQRTWAGTHVRRQSGEKPCHNKTQNRLTGPVYVYGRFREDLLIERDIVGRKSWLRSNDMVFKWSCSRRHGDQCYNQRSTITHGWIDGQARKIEACSSTMYVLSANSLRSVEVNCMQLPVSPPESDVVMKTIH